MPPVRSAGERAARPRRLLPHGTVLRSRVMRSVAVAGCLLAACAGAPRPAPDAPGSPSASASGPPTELAVDPPEGSAASITFAPAGEPAERYNGPPPAIPHTAFGDAVAAAVREEAAR